MSLTYFAQNNEVWRVDDNGKHLAVVIRPIDGSLDARADSLAQICADALNCPPELFPKFKEMVEDLFLMRERGQDRLSAVDFRREEQHGNDQA